MNKIQYNNIMIFQVKLITILLTLEVHNNTRQQIS